MAYKVSQLRYKKYLESRAYYQTTFCNTCGVALNTAKNYNFNRILYTVRKVELDPEGRKGYDAFPLVGMFCSNKCAQFFLLSKI